MFDYHTVEEALNNTHLPLAKRRASLQAQLIAQAVQFEPEKNGVEMARSISYLLDSYTAKELQDHYLTYQVLDLAGYLELPKAHRAGVTWNDLTNAAEALATSQAPENCAPIDASKTYYILNDISLPLKKRENQLKCYILDLLSINQGKHEDVAYLVAGLLGTVTAQQLAEGYKLYRCLLLAKEVSLSSGEQQAASLSLLLHAIRELDSSQK